jgi:hypothetical protein
MSAEQSEVFHIFDFSFFGFVGQGWRGDRTRAGLQ